MSDLDNKKTPLDPEIEAAVGPEGTTADTSTEPMTETAEPTPVVPVTASEPDAPVSEPVDEPEAKKERGTVHEEAKARKKAEKKARKPQVDARNRQLKRFSVMSIVFVVVVAVLLNVLLQVLVGDSLRFDWTSNKIMTLGETSEALLDDLDRDVEIYVLNTPENLEAQDSTNWIPGLLEEYVAKSHGHVTVSYVNPTVDPTILTTLDPEGLAGVMPGQIVVRNPESQRVRTLNPRDFLNIQQNPQTGQRMMTGYSGEEAISGAIKAMSSDNVPVVYLTTGHNEANAQQQYSVFLQLLQNNGFEVENYNGLLGDPIPEDAAALVMLAPATDITTDEIGAYDTYLKRGGSLVALVPFSGTQYPNLNTLLAEYDLRLGEDRAIEGDVSVQFEQQPEAFLAHNPVSTILPSESGDVQPATLIMNARNITTAQNAKEWITTEPVLHTSADGALQLKGDSENLSNAGEQVVAMYSENRGSVDGSAVTEPARVLVYGSDMVFSDAILNTFGQSSLNVAFAYQSVAAMVDMEAAGSNDLLIRPRPPVNYRVDTSSPNHLMVAAVVTAVVIPLLLIAAAVFVYVKRKNL